MKFCDKLPKLRKQNNITQEQLADKMGVSRQAVSKWEQGISIPDMDKMIQLCNILNCTLEDLLDDGVIEDNKNQTKKNNFQDYFHDFLKYITNIYNMFCAMKFKEKIKCLFEMLLVFSILLIFFLLIFSLIDDFLLDNLNLIPVAGNLISFLLSNILILALIILGLIIFFHIFKIRYLDYYVTIEDKNTTEQKIETPIENANTLEKTTNHEYINIPKKEKIIIRDPKHSSFSFFEFLVKIFLFITKIFVSFFTILVVIFFLFAIIFLVFLLWHINFGIIFLYISIAVFGVLILTYIFLELFYNFLISHKQHFKRIFILAILALLLFGFGTGSAIVTYLNFDSVVKIDTKTDIIQLEMDENLILMNDTYYFNPIYEIDDDKENIEIKVVHPTITEVSLNKYLSWDYLITNLYLRGNFFETYHFVLNTVKNKEMLPQNEQLPFDVTITLSTKNYQKLMSNKEKYENYLQTIYN